ncbi:thioredoxin family protein [Oleidesulfovibrio sp.]|uniref:thioredoxin family protein n=1 Tax=Oleidesulfovibrio sp. TaxID=2909707 RepID=UPI003A842DB2
MVTVVTPEQFADLLQMETRPVLAGCLQRDSGFMEQCMILQAVATAAGKDAQICLLDPDWLNEFCKKYSISGTPSFLLFEKGNEQGRFLGKAELHNLLRMVRVKESKVEGFYDRQRRNLRLDMELSSAGSWV